MFTCYDKDLQRKILSCLVIFKFYVVVFLQVSGGISSCLG